MKPPEPNFYTNAAWRHLRLAALKRDHFRCTVCGVYVGGKGDSRVDHIKPRAEYPELELDLGNLRTFCALHDNQRHFEKGGGSPRGCGPDGWPTARDDGMQAVGQGGRTGPLSHPAGLRPSTVPLVVVTGAPASGKSTWVEAQRGADDLVIDLDEIGSRMAGGDVGHHWPRALLERTLRHRNASLGMLGEAGCPNGSALASGVVHRLRALAPVAAVVGRNPATRAHRGHGHADERVRQAGGWRQARIAIIMRHFAQYRPRVGDTVVQGGEVQGGGGVVAGGVWV